MGFGEEYMGMKDREIIIEVATRLKNVEQKLDGIQCPSPKCGDHETRLTKLEQRNETETQGNSNIVAWGGLIIGILAVLVAIWAVVGV